MRASGTILGLKGQLLDVLTIAKPPDIEYARNLAKVVSKLSPLVGNMIEFSIVNLLNSRKDWPNNGHWVRQDPGFPDTLFVGDLNPSPGVEIKAWFPLATEITARFRDSASRFEYNQVNVAIIAWLPEYLLYGKPKVVDVWIGSAKSLAMARDLHYHDPPNYLVIEPEDTKNRTINLQQTNTNGYKFQEGPERLALAVQEVEQWGAEGKIYKTAAVYQEKLRKLLGRYRYRLDTNFAKMDRIQHPGLEAFKAQVLNSTVYGYTIFEWAKQKLLHSDAELQKLLVSE
ncbi:MAG: hypothetical protein JXB47_19200 [Anaerolineae bacterium]|nr:hypothetical protein [Anaerolineae bacterium]